MVASRVQLDISRRSERSERSEPVRDGVEHSKRNSIQSPRAHVLFSTCTYVCIVCNSIPNPDQQMTRKQTLTVKLQTGGVTFTNIERASNYVH